MDGIVSFLQNDLGPIVAAVLSIIGAAATVAASFKPEWAAKLGAVGETIRKVANVIGLNIGAAKNATDVPADDKPAE